MDVEKRIRDIKRDDALASAVGKRIAEVVLARRSPKDPNRYILGMGYIDKTDAGLARTMLTILLGELK